MFINDGISNFIIIYDVESSQNHLT